jgi:RIO-like serine/threonine protein kinase
MAIENDGNGDDSLSVISRYTRFKENELSRLKKLKKTGLVSILNRKMKDNGARHAVSGLVDNLCLLVFECNIQFLSTR